MTRSSRLSSRVWLASPTAATGVVLQAQIYEVAASGGVHPSNINTYTFLWQGVGLSNCSSCPASDGAHGNWKPSARSVSLTDGLATLGVRVFYGHDWILGSKAFLPNLSCGVAENCLTESAVMRLEPME